MGARNSRPASATSPLAQSDVVVGVPVTTPSDEPKQEDKCVPTASNQLDLVFTMDCTGSMGSYIRAAKTNIEAIVSRLVQSEGYDLRFGLIGYRDHPPQDQSYVTKAFPFTSEVTQMQANLKQLSAQGGGDGPEAVEAGLKATLDSAWRPNATKVCILIADAPPHGLGESGDGFPEGAPTGVDPMVVLDQMSCSGITIYSVGCEPALSGYRHAKAFMIAAAQKTNGQAVSLSSAAALADVIMGGAVEEMDLEALAAEVVQEVEKFRSARPADADYDSEEETKLAWREVGARGHVTRHMKTKKLRSKRAGAMKSAATLADARSCLTSVKSSKGSPPPLRPAYRCHLGTAGSLDALASPCVSASPGARESFGALASASDSDDDDRYGSDGSDAEGAEGEGGGAGVRLEHRALSFSQVSRIYGKQKKMGFL